jgi:putative exporter of polyketide antibiotics
MLYSNITMVIDLDMYTHEWKNVESIDWVMIITAIVACLMTMGMMGWKCCYKL